MDDVDIAANINFKASIFIELDFFKDDHFVVFRVASRFNLALLRVATKIFKNSNFQAFFQSSTLMYDYL